VISWATLGCGSDGNKTTTLGTAGTFVGGAGIVSGPAGAGAAGRIGVAGTGTVAGAAGSAIAGRGVAGTGVSGAGSSAAGSPAAGSPAAGTGTAGATAGTGTGGATAGTGTGGATAGGGAGTGMMGAGACCKDGDCLCHGEPPAAPTNMAGPFKTMSYDIASAGCVFYPTDAEPPFAAVTISDGFGGSGGCGPSQTGQWGPLYASWGIVAMIIHTGSGDQPQQRGTKLTAGVAAFKMENMKSGSPLMGKLSGRYGTSGFSMGGGGTTFSAMADKTLKSNVSIMAWTPATSGITVPSLFIFGSSDTLAGTMGMSSYRSIMGTTPKMAVTVNSGHAGQPTSGGGASGKAGLAFQKVYLEGDERWKPILGMIMATEKANLD
jgi:hypothetical protein